MFRSRFLFKLYAGYAVLILLTALVVGVLVSRRVEEDTVEGIEHNLLVSTHLLAELAGPHLDQPPDPEFERRVQDLGARIGVRLTVIGPQGTVLADSEEDPRLMDDHSGRPEILAARDAGIGIATRRSDTVHTNMKYVALAIRSDDGRLRGFARSALPLTELDRRLAQLHRIVAVAATIAALVGLALGLAFARRVTAPLASMTRAAEAIASGQHQRIPRVDSSDEIGRLARSFDRMAATLRERMETIERDRAKLLAILSSMVEGVVAIDGDERVVHLNEVAARILHTTPEAAIGRRIWEATRVREVCEALEATLAGGGQARREVRVLDETRDRLLDLYAVPLRSGEGAVSGGVVVLHDVTELRRLEGVRRDFVANVSHELKTPLTAIRGLVETLLDDEGAEPAILRRFLGKIRDQTSRLSTLVTDLLALSRFESAEVALQIEPLDLRSPARESVAAFLPIAREKDVSLESELPPEPVEIEGDREALRQLADNLVSNAVQYTPAGGRVRVRVRRAETEAVLEVEDTGIGIEPRHQERIFERFYRVDRARSRELGGTGLGLSIVKHVALAHGGRVSLESSPGRGSTFRVHLPGAKAGELRP